MRQQINLHQPIFRKQRALFSSGIVLRVCGIWVIALAIVYMLSLWREGVLSTEKTTLLQERDTASNRLQALFLRQTDPELSASLEAELQQIMAQRQEKEGVIRVLARGDLGITTGFSPQIRALAERRLEGVWLTQVLLDEGGKYVSLKGRAIGEEMLPQYIERLAGRIGESRFPGGRFGEVSLKRETDEAGIRFELRTQAGEGRR